MDDLGKKALLDLCVTPAVVLPVTAGVSLLMLSIILGSHWVFFGVVCCLIGLGFLVTNLLCNIDKVYQKALNQLMEQKKKERNNKLDFLKNKLWGIDLRSPTALHNLRNIYDCFFDDVHDGKITVSVPSSMVDQIDGIFEGCVAQLERECEVWQTSRKVTGVLQEDLLKQKETILVEVEASVNSLAEVINEVRALGIKSHTGELAKLQQRLNSQLAVAKATEQLSDELDSNMSRFADYD